MGLRRCVANAPTNKSAEPIDKIDPPLTGPTNKSAEPIDKLDTTNKSAGPIDKLDTTNKSAEPIDKLDPPLTGPAAKWWCARFHGCERSYLDPVWDRDEEKSAWRLSDYSDFKLRCLAHK